MSHDLLLLLRRSPAFARLDDEELLALRDAFRVGEHAPGYVFCREGDRSEDVWMVTGGEVAVSSRGTEIARLRPGDLFGLAALVDGGVRAATCRAAGDVGPCTAARLSRADADRLFRQAAPIAIAFQRAVARQLARDFRQMTARLTRGLGRRGAAIVKR